MLACIVALSFLPTSESVTPITTQAPSYSGMTLSGITEKTRSAVERILADSEVQLTLRRIETDTPRYHQDGAVFMNLERHLPVQKEKNYYHE